MSQHRHQHSDLISIHVTSASGRAACGDKTPLRYTAFSSHYMDTSKNILNSKQIRWGVRLQNILFMVGNGKVAADEEFVVWQVHCPHGMAGALPSWHESALRGSLGVSMWLHQLGKDLTHEPSA